MMTYDQFFAALIYIGAIIILSVLFYFLPKYKNPYFYTFWSGFILQLPFVAGLLSHPPKENIIDILFYMSYFTWGGSLFGFAYYYLFVRRKVQ